MPTVIHFYGLVWSPEDVERAVARWGPYWHTDSVRALCVWLGGNIPGVEPHTPKIVQEEVKPQLKRIRRHLYPMRGEPEHAQVDVVLEGLGFEIHPCGWSESNGGLLSAYGTVTKAEGALDRLPPMPELWRAHYSQIVAFCLLLDLPVPSGEVAWRIQTQW